jgi:hypothetical protein
VTKGKEDDKVYRGLNYYNQYIEKKESLIGTGYCLSYIEKKESLIGTGYCPHFLSVHCG